METPEHNSANELTDDSGLTPDRQSTADALCVSSLGDVNLRHGNGSLLVAVNGQASGWEALDWAAAESAARQAPLRILHVINPPLFTLDPLCSVPLNLCDTRAADQGHRILDEAAARARRLAPGLMITTHLEIGGTAGAIARAGRSDALIVIGRGRRKPFGRWSVGWRTARRAHGAMTVVSLDHERATGPSAGRVVVGVAEISGSSPALAYAFQAASSRCTGLTVIHACSLTAPPRHAKSTLGFSVDDLRRLAAIDATVHAYRNAFPDVDVRRHFTASTAWRALAAESSGAALVVVGSRPNTRLHRTGNRSIVHDIYESVQSPIAIVPMLQPTTLRSSHR